MDVEESTDFDFFDTPRQPVHSDSDPDQNSDQRKAQTKSPHVGSHSDGLEKSKRSSQEQQQKSQNQRPSSALSGSSLSHSDLSDSVSSLSESGDDDQPQRSPSKNRSITPSSSTSSFSDSSRSCRRSRKYPVDKSQRHSDSEDTSQSCHSKSSVSSNSNRGDRKGKSRISYGGDKKHVSRVTKNVSEQGKSSKHPKKEEEEYSSSAYSDGEDAPSEIRHSLSDHQQSSKSQEAWTVGKTKDTQPKTGKRCKTAAGVRRHKCHTPPSSYTGSASDSDITDVSPIDSPRPSHNAKGSLSDISAAGDNQRAKAKFKALPIHEEDDQIPGKSNSVDSAGIDLKILMKAVGELEKKKRVEANSRRVMFAPMTLKSNEKSNYTFDRDQSHDIDRENDRLLKEIVKQVQADRKKQYYRSPEVSRHKLTPSAVNREKEMKRIEADNLNFLKRLQKVKATTSISRNQQLKSYETTKLHGIPMAALHPMTCGNSRPSSQMTRSFSSLGSRTRSLSSLHSVASTVRSSSSKRGSRPSSATKRVEHRPEWSDRW